MAVVAVICRYWQERDTNLPRIISDLRAGTLPPDEILVWDQGPQPAPAFDATVIRSTKNFATRARLIAALLYDAEHFVFIDDDITVGRNTIEKLVGALSKTDVACVRGIGHDDEPLSSGLHEQDQHVRWVIGRLMAVTRTALVRFVADENRLGLFDYCEDALLGSHGALCVAGAEWYDLDDQGVGLNYEPWYEKCRQEQLARIP